MTEFSEKKPEGKTFQLSGIFCFYSKTRAARESLDQNGQKVTVNEYDTTVYKMGYGMVTVNYYGTLLSDGTPGGIAGNEFVRPDQPASYILIGKVIPNGGGHTVLGEVDLEKEIRLQSGLPLKEPEDHIPPAKEQPLRKTPDIMEQFEQHRKQRKAFDKKSDARMKQYKNKFTPKKK